MTYPAVTDVLYAILLTMADRTRLSDADKNALKSFTKSLNNSDHSDQLSEAQQQEFIKTLTNSLTDQVKTIYDQKLEIVGKFSAEAKARFRIPLADYHRLTGVQFARRQTRAANSEISTEIGNAMALSTMVDNELKKDYQSQQDQGNETPNNPDLSPISQLFSQP